MKVLLTTYHNNQISSGMYPYAAIASYLETYTDAEIKVVDAQREPLFDILDSWKPDIIAIGSYTVWHAEVVEQAWKIKAKAPYAKLLIGGYHITSMPSSFENSPFDYAILGEAEEAFAMLVNGENLLRIPGLIVRGNLSTIPPVPVDINTLPVVDLVKYTPKWLYNGVVGMTTSRGCYFNCSYCNIRTMSKKVRLRSVKTVVNEIELYYKVLNIRHIVFWDDVFGLNKAWLVQFMLELGKRNLIGKIKYSIHVRADTVTRELCTLWKQLGVVAWNMGIDFGNDTILLQTKGKGYTVEKIKEALLLSGEFGFVTGCSFIFGAPRETFAQMKETLSLLDWYIDMKNLGKIHHSSHMWFFVATPLPGTMWWNTALKEGKITRDIDLRRLSLHNWSEHLLLSPSVTNEEFSWIHEEAKKRMIIINGSFNEY